MTAPILAGIAMVRGPHFEACDGMTCYWIYDLPNWKLGLLIVSIIVSGSILGYLVSRRTVRKLLGSSDRYNDVVSWVFTGVGVFYGLALGLIAVATWENYSDIDAHASKEAALIGALFDDLDGYGPPYQASPGGPTSCLHPVHHREGLAGPPSGAGGRGGHPPPVPVRRYGHADRAGLGPREAGPRPGHQRPQPGGRRGDSACRRSPPDCRRCSGPSC